MLNVKKFGRFLFLCVVSEDKKDLLKSLFSF